MNIYKIALHWVMPNLNEAVNVFYFQSEYFPYEPGGVLEFTDDVTAYLDNMFTNHWDYISNSAGTVYYNVYLVVPGIGESLVASPIYVRTGTAVGDILPSQNSFYLYARGFLHRGVAKKYITGVSAFAISSGVLTAGARNAFIDMATQWTSVYAASTYILTPGFMSKAKVDGVEPEVPYFVPFLPASSGVNDQVSTLNRRKQGRGS